MQLICCSQTDGYYCGAILEVDYYFIYHHMGALLDARP
jgi:hypothetical protein